MIEQWLVRHGKGDSSAGGWERLWPRIEDLGDRDRMELVIARVGLQLGENGAKSGASTAPDATSQEQDLVDEALRGRLVAAVHGAAQGVAGGQDLLAEVAG